MYCAHDSWFVLQVALLGDGIMGRQRGGNGGAEGKLGVRWGRRQLLRIS